MAQRICHMCGREDEHPGTVPLPPDAAAGPGPAYARRARVRPWRGCRLLSRLRRAPGAGLRALRRHDGYCPFGRLVDQVMTTGPYASAERVFWVVDNGSSHRGQASVGRLEGEWHNLRLVHLPKYASWLDQAEIYFSVVQRKVVSPNDFFDLDAIAARLAGWLRATQ